jgi:hypothetical protein
VHQPGISDLQNAKVFEQKRHQYGKERGVEGKLGIHTIHQSDPLYGFQPYVWKFFDFLFQ